MKLIIITWFAMTLNHAIADNHDHHAKHTKTKHIAAKKVKKQFIPTKDLKVRMEKILNLTKELNPKKDDVKVVKSYGDKINETVNDIFKTCKLEPDADAAIHPTLGLILDGASEFKNGRYESGHKNIHEALLIYENMFKHEGWNH